MLPELAQLLYAGDRVPVDVVARHAEHFTQFLILFLKQLQLPFSLLLLFPHEFHLSPQILLELQDGWLPFLLCEEATGEVPSSQGPETSSKEE